MSGSASEYERLAERELEAGATADSDEARSDHLNLATTFAHLSALHSQSSDEGVAKAEIIACLRASLIVADRFGLAVAAIHINEAIIALDGTGVPPPKSL